MNMEETKNARCPRCQRDIQIDWLACPHCRTYLQTYTTRGKRPRLMIILVGVIVLLLLLLLGVGGYGAWWYYVKSPMTKINPMQTSEPTIIVETLLATPIAPEIAASSTLTVTAPVVQVTRLSDLPIVSLSLSSDTISETGGSTTVTAQLSHVSESNVDVKLKYSGSATGQGKDYSVSSNIITIPAGSIRGNSLITAIPDSDIEGEETIIINIAEVDNAAPEEGSQVTTTIVQTNPGPNLILVVSPVTIMESGGQAHVTLVVSETHSSDIGINLSFAGSAAYGKDYHADSRFILISAGSRTGTPAIITGLPDNIVEGEESIRISIESITSESHDIYVCAHVDEDRMQILGDSVQLGSAALNQLRAGCLVVDFRTIIIDENNKNRGRSISDAHKPRGTDLS